MTEPSAMVSVLRGVHLFQGMSEAGLAAIAERAEMRTFSSGRELFRQHDLAGSLYVIVEGRVRVERSHAELTGPVVAELAAGDVVGEDGLLDRGPRSATVTALEETRAMELPADSLAHILLEFGDTSGALLPTLSRRLRSVDDLAEELASQGQR